MNECLFYFPYIHRTIFSSWPFLSLRWILSKWPQLEQLTFINFSGQPTDTTPSHVGAERPSCLVSETNPLWSINTLLGRKSEPKRGSKTTTQQKPLYPTASFCPTLKYPPGEVFSPWKHMHPTVTLHTSTQSREGVESKKMSAVGGGV